MSNVAVIFDFFELKDTTLLKRTLFPILAVLAFAAPHAAHAQYLNLNDGDVVTLSGAGTVGTVGGVPVANNTTSYSGLYFAAQTSGNAIFTLGTGGTLTGYGFGLQIYGSGPITISGGTISATASGGIALNASGTGPVTITGGTFDGGVYDLVSTYRSTIDLYGAFDGLTLGQTQVLPKGSTGTFYGTLQNNATPQAFTYQNDAAITLHDVGLASAPEPSPFAAFAIGVLGLGALGLRARRRSAA